MSKLRKVCAILCSGMCALGSASANPGKNGNSIMEIAASNPEFFESSVEKFRNEEIAKTERMRKISAYGPESALWFGSIFGERADSAMAIGRADVLDNRDILKLMSKADIDSLKKMANKEKIKSILNYIFLRCILPMVPAAVTGALCTFLASLVTCKRDESGKIVEGNFKGAGGVNILVFIVIYLATYNNVAFAFNKIAHREWGRNKELQDMCKEILEIAERVKRNMQSEKNIQKKKSKKRNMSASVEKGRNNLNSAIDKKKAKNQRLKDMTSNKAKLTKAKVSNINVVSKNSSKADELSKSVGATPVAQ